MSRQLNGGQSVRNDKDRKYESENAGLDDNGTNFHGFKTGNKYNRKKLHVFNHCKTNATTRLLCKMCYLQNMMVSFGKPELRISFGCFLKDSATDFSEPSIDNFNLQKFEFKLSSTTALFNSTLATFCIIDRCTFCLSFSLPLVVKLRHGYYLAFPAEQTLQDFV
jgi:hypothetical protein